MRWRRRPQNPIEVLLNSIGSLFGHDGRGPDSLNAYVRSLPTEASMGILGTLATTEELFKIRALGDDIFDEIEPGQSTSQALSLGSVMHERLLTIFGVSDRPESRHPFEAQLAQATVHSSQTAFSQGSLEDASAVLTEGLSRLASFVVFAERNAELPMSQGRDGTGANPSMVKQRERMFRRFLLPGETPLNVGSSFLLDGRQDSDGYLVITDQRFLFVFDEDFRRSPFYVLRENVTGIDFLPTDVVPLSEVLVVGYKGIGYYEIARMYVGSKFADEIRRLTAI